ncbi:CoA transferase, partial [Microbacterium sp.]|uniref:CoA transferase n=1 Tax=Microbacterium sp. TaxID=51671 RepID=UPI0025F72001
MDGHGALDGVRILELTTGIAGPFAGMLLADHGAEVLTVDLVTADPVADAADGQAVWDRGKTRVTLDLSSDAGRRWLADRLPATDALLVSRLPVAGTAWDQRTLTEMFPALEILVMPPYLDIDGSTPWAGGAESHGLLSATAGTAYSQGSADDVPVELVYPHLLYVQGIWAATVLVAALVERQRSGTGQLITVAGMHGMTEGAAAAMVHAPGTPRTHQPGGPGGPIPFYRPYRCADGQWLFLACLTPNFFMKAFE